MKNNLKTTISIFLLTVYAALAGTVDFWHTHAGIATTGVQEEIVQPHTEAMLTWAKHDFCIACQFSFVQLLPADNTQHFNQFEIYSPLLPADFLSNHRIEQRAIRAPPFS